MNSHIEIPLAGFSLEKVYAAEQSQRTVQADDLPADPEQRIGFGWDWRILEPRLFEVMLHIGLGPTKGRPEEVGVSICGVFRIMGEATSVRVLDFVRVQGPAILMPFVRESISSLTSRGYFGQVLLPPINVQVLMQQRDPKAATGAKQLESPEGERLVLGA